MVRNLPRRSLAAYPYSMLRRMTVLFGVFLALLVVSACSSDPYPTSTPLPSPKFIPTECPFDKAFHLEVICGTVTVPKIRSDIGRGTYDLAVAVLISPNPRPAPEPVIYLTGGPGKSALASLEVGLENIFAPFLADRDVVVFDQRGSGFSEPETYCTELRELAIDLLDEPLSAGKASIRRVEAANACFDRLVATGVEFGALSTAESAQDVHAIMRSLGYESWNLLGVSYGTRLAQTVMRDRPEGVRAVILDSVIPIEDDFMAQIPENFSRALATLIDDCASSHMCAQDFPDIESKLLEAANALNTKPQAGTVSNKMKLDSYDALTSGGDFAEQVFLSLYSTQMIPVLPEMITLAASGQVDLINLARGAELSNGALLSEGVQIAIQCREEVPFTTEQAIIDAAKPYTTVHTLLEGASRIGAETLDICKHWGQNAADSLENQAVESDLPTLVIAGAYDPLTSPSTGRQFARRLPNASFALAQSSGHVALGSSACSRHTAVAFLRAPEESIDAACGHDDPQILWARPLSTIEFEPFKDSLIGVEGIRPAGWMEVAPGAFSRSTFGAITLFQQVVPGITGQQLVDSLGNAFSHGNPLRHVNQVTSQSWVWDVYSNVTFGQQIIIAIAEHSDHTSFVMITGLPGQASDLYTVLLDPVIDSFNVLP
jgi:pimeloyl-ACP methyl ester carboxylesterase